MSSIYIVPNAVSKTTCTPYDSNKLLPERHSHDPRGGINISSDMESNQLVDGSLRYRNDEMVPQAKTSQLSGKRQANAVRSRSASGTFRYSQPRIFHGSLPLE